MDKKRGNLAYVGIAIVIAGLVLLFVATLPGLLWVGLIGFFVLILGCITAMWASFLS